MKILITGVGGFVGRSLARAWRQASPDRESTLDEIAQHAEASPHWLALSES